MRTTKITFKLKFKLFSVTIKWSVSIYTHLLINFLKNFGKLVFECYHIIRTEHINTK